MAELTTLLIFAGILLFAMLIGREIVCWYFKLNRIAETLDRISEQLKNRNNGL